MRRVRKRREHVSVSLFPFLAVLICTLGVLIVMLVMAVQNADVEARKKSEANQQQAQDRIDELQAKLDSQKVMIDGLSMVRPEATARLAQVRDKRGYLEDEIRKLDREGEQLANQLVELVNRKKQATQVQEIADEDFDVLESRISEAKSKLATVQQASAEFETVAYSIVPTEASGGTQRRPIYVECDRRGVVLQPFNLVLTSEDFPEPIFPGNPLDAALLVIRQYWKKHDLAGRAGNPYPLLVIRPTGAQSYVAARLAMKSWDDEFGYETIEASKELDFGSVDEALKREIELAIDQARKNQRNLIAASVERRVRRRAATQGGRGGQGWVASGEKGGFKEFTGNQGGETNSEITSPAAEQARNRPKPSYDSVLDRYVTGNTAPQRNRRAVSRPAPPQHGSPTANSSNEGNGPLKLGNLSDSRESLATSRGEGWALPSKTPNAVGYLRPLKVHCTESRMGVFGGNSNQPVIIEFDGDAENAVDELIDYLWKQIDTWGSAGNNAYWRPELRVKVQPGGERRFRELQQLLDRSGLEIKESTR